MPSPKPLKLKTQCPPEEVEAQWFIQELRRRYRECPILERVYHVPSEGSGSVKRGLLLKEMGVIPGILDYALDSPRIRPDGQLYHGWKGELKRLRESYPSTDQRKTIALLNEQGYRAGWFKGHARMLADILWYVGLPEPMPGLVYYEPFEYISPPAERG